MVEREITVNNATGLHARPASLLVAQAAKSKSKVTIRFNDKIINAKSMLNVLGGGIKKGSRIVIVGEGADEQETVDAICNLIASFEE
jgi:phosphocarrier protein HPr